MLAGAPTQSPRGGPLSTAQPSPGRCWRRSTPEHSSWPSIRPFGPLGLPSCSRQAPPSFSPSPSAATKTRPDPGLPLSPTAGSSQAGPLASLSTQMPCVKMTVLVS